MNKIYHPKADARWCKKNLERCIVSPSSLEFERNSLCISFPLVDIVEMQFGPRPYLFEQPFRLPDPEEQGINETLFFQAQNFFWKRGAIDFSISKFLELPFYYYEHSPGVLTKEYDGVEFRLSSIRYEGDVPEWVIS